MTAPCGCAGEVRECPACGLEDVVICSRHSLEPICATCQAAATETPR